MTPQQPLASPNPGMPPAVPPNAPPVPNPVPPAANPFVQPQVDPFSNANSIQMAPEPVFPIPVPTPTPASPQPVPANPAMVAQPLPQPIPNPTQPMMQPAVEPAAPIVQPPVEPVPPAAPVAQPVAEPMPPVAPTAPPVAPELVQPIPPQLPVEPTRPMTPPVTPPEVAQPIAQAVPQPIPESPQPIAQPVPPIEQPIVQSPVEPVAAPAPVAQPVAEPMPPVAPAVPPATPVEPAIAQSPIPPTPLEAPQPTTPQPIQAPVANPTQPVPIASTTEPAPVAAPVVVADQALAAQAVAPVAEPVIDPMLAAQPVAPQAVSEMSPAAPIPVDPAQAVAAPTDSAAPAAEPEQPMGAVDLESELSPEEVAEVTAEAENTEPTTPKATQAPTTQFDDSVVEAPAAIPPMGLMSEPAKKSKLPLIAGILALLIIAGVAVYLLFFSEKKEELAILDDTVILLPDKGGDGSKAAVFNYSTGEKVTDFIYNSGSGFVGGYAQVTNADGKDGIINNKGEATVDFGAFDSIRSRGALYAARKGDELSIITARGDKVVSVKEDDKVFGAYEGVYFTVVRHNNQNDIYTIQGKKIDSFETDKDLSFRQKGNLVSISYPGAIITLDNKELKVLKKYSFDSDKIFGVYDTSDKSDLVIVTTIFSLEDENNKKTEYGVLSGDQVYDFSESCTYLDFMKNTNITNLYNDGGVVVCSKENEANKHYNYSIVRSDGTLKKLDTNNSYSFTSEQDYIIAYGASFLGNSNKIEFYQGGSIAKTLTGSFGYITYDQGNISAYDSINKKTALYNNAGEPIIESSVNPAVLLGPYDNDTYITNAFVNNYLSDKDGKRLSSPYDYLIYNKCASFVASNYDLNSRSSRYILLDGTGKEVTKIGEYNRFTCLDNGSTIAIRTDKKGFTVFGSDFTTLGDGEYGSYLYSGSGYIEVEFESPHKFVFYTYDGKKFHEYGE